MAGKVDGFPVAFTATNSVLGTLVGFLDMRKVNTRGLELAHKGILVAAAAYNLQKLLHFTPKTSQPAVMALPRPELEAFFRLTFGRIERGEIRRRIGSTSYC